MSVALNPEVPEFIPKDLAASLKNGLLTMHKVTKLSNNLPIEAAYKKFKEIPDFNVVANQLCHIVFYQLNSVFQTEIPSHSLKEDNVDYTMEKIIDANDCLLDRVNHNIQCVGKGMTSSDLPTRNLAPGISAAALNPPIVTKIKIGSATFTGAKNITRPQLLFKDAVDNTATVWMPKLQDKPNNIKSLDLQVQYDKEGDIVGFEHPYLYELSLFQPLPDWLVPDTELPTFPLPVSETNYTYITTADQIDELVNHLVTVKELAIDLEHHSYRSYQGFTCLMQITTTAGDYIIDALATREYLQKLNLIFTDPKKLKIFHGADNDVVWLQRDFGVYIVGMFDTHQAARLLQHSSKSLSALLKRYCNIDIDKTHQLADWRLRPLTDDMIYYARSDTHFLSYIWHCMKSDLLAASGGQPDMLLAAFETSRQVCGLTYRKQVLTDDSHLKLYYRNMKSFNCRQMTALRMLYKWRDDHARRLDESTMYLLPNHMLLSLAEKLPREIQGVTAICNQMPPFVKQNLVAIHKMLLSCREMSADAVISAGGDGVAYMEPPQLEYEVHDMEVDEDLDHVSLDQDDHVSLDQDLTELMSVVSLGSRENELQPTISTDGDKHLPDLKLYYEPNDTTATQYDWKNSSLLSPYTRYKYYRILTQKEEIREFKEREAKIIALSRGNELIKTEVLLKMQAANPQALNEKQGESSVSTQTPSDGSEASISGVLNEESVAVDTDPSSHNKKLTNAQNMERPIKSVHESAKKDTGNTDRECDPAKNTTRYYYNSSNYMKFRNVDKSVDKKCKK